VTTFSTEPLNQLAEEIHTIAVNHGWWSEPRSFGDICALIHSEVSEALEEYRDGRGVTETRHTYHSDSVPEQLQWKGTVYIRSTEEDIDERDGEFRAHMKMLQEEGYLKPEGVPTELADIIIRVLDAAHQLGIDIDKAIAEKVAYNDNRPFRHGGKVL
jgi:NTP pyrophosphatase (non-canonical NTP hydrolase)